MSYYLLADTMQPCTGEELHAQKDYKYVAVLTTPEWKQERELFDMGIELEPDAGNIHNTKAEVNYDFHAADTLSRMVWHEFSLYAGA